MSNEREELLVRIIGKADLCELLSAAFAFPDEALARALCDGTFSKDALACLQDVGASAADSEQTDRALHCFAGQDEARLFVEMRKAYSILYLTPGADVPVFPYEGAFRFVADGRKGSPALFRSPTTLDVERHLKEAGVLPKTVRTEPCDSVFGEFEFLAYLFASCAEAIRKQDDLAEAEWSARTANFCEEHAERWLPAFMERTKEAALKVGTGGEYAALSSFASKALLKIFESANSNKLQKC